MEYYLYLNDEQKGPYTINQIQSMWRSGSITGNTLYWQEGFPDWIPLSSILHVLEPPPAAPASSLPKATVKQAPVAPTTIKPAQSANVASAFFLILFIVGIVIFISLSGGSNNPFAFLNFLASTSPTGESASGASRNLSVLNAHWKQGEFGTKTVAGTVVNSGTKTYGYAQVSINLYDSSGTQIGSTFANINNLEPGKSWDFEAVVIDSKATSFKVMEITGF